MKLFKEKSLSPPVFYPSAILIFTIVGFAIFATETTQSIFESTQDWILNNTSWFYILTVAIILLATVFLAISRYGDIKL